MTRWQPTQQQQQQYETDGYFILRDVIPQELAFELRGVIKNVIMLPAPGKFAENDPMNPKEDSPNGRIARYRKLGNFCIQSPLIWHNVHAGPNLLAVARYFLGDDIILKFNSCFLKPPRTGSATPWHQDNGLWRDGELDPFNFWMALDPATRENGCMQFIPGSHKTDILPHVLYEDSIHAELPRERVTQMVEKHSVHHIQLNPGDVVFWHSSMWHYSPPNPSAHGRIAVAGVWTNPEIAKKSRYFWALFRWVMKNGEPCPQFPPEVYPVGAGKPESPPAFPRNPR